MLCINEWKESSVPILFLFRNRMRTILVLCLVAGALAAQCGRGGLTCTGNQCHYPAYLEGCLTYSPDNQCQECHFSKTHFMQTMDSAMEDASTPPTQAVTAASHSTATVDALNAPEDSYPTSRVDSAKTSRSLAASSKATPDAKFAARPMTSSKEHASQPSPTASATIPKPTALPAQTQPNSNLEPACP